MANHFTVFFQIYIFELFDRFKEFKNISLKYKAMVRLILYWKKLLVSIFSISGKVRKKSHDVITMWKLVSSPTHGSTGCTSACLFRDTGVNKYL